MPSLHPESAGDASEGHHRCCNRLPSVHVHGNRHALGGDTLEHDGIDVDLLGRTAADTPRGTHRRRTVVSTGERDPLRGHHVEHEAGECGVDGGEPVYGAERRPHAHQRRQIARLA